MPAELHLAEDAFALHLSLQRLEGLIDIVVADENLHVVFLFNPTVDRLNSRKAPDHWRTDMRNSLYPDPKVPFGGAYTASGRLPVTKNYARKNNGDKINEVEKQALPRPIRSPFAKSVFSCGEAASAKRLRRNHWIVIPRVGRPRPFLRRTYVTLVLQSLHVAA